jgi:WD40 repeat protein
VKMCCSRVVLIIILRYVEPYDDWSCVNTLSKHSGTVWCVDFNAQGNKFVSCSDDLSVGVC